MQPDLQRRFRAGIFIVVLTGWTLLIGIAGVSVILVPAAASRVARWWGQGVQWLLACVVGLRCEVDGALPEAGPYLVVSRHESAWETFAFLSLIPHPVYVLKRELLWIPVFGWYAWRMGCIGINRREPVSALRQVAARAGGFLREARALIIYPEGTRLPPGQYRPFQRSFAQIAHQAEVPMVPVAHNAGTFWPRRWLDMRPGRIRVRILPACMPAASVAETTVQVQHKIQEACVEIAQASS